MATTKVKAPPKTTGAEVMAMFKGITPSKGYASKLNSLLNFLGLTSNIRIGAEVVETGLNISESGELMPSEAMRRYFIDRKVSRLSFLDKEERELEGKQREFNRERYECNKLLRSKAKSVTDKKRENATARLVELETAGNEVSHELAKLRGRIKVMVDAERKKLEATEFTIAEMRRDQDLMEGVKVKVTLETGTYTFPIPSETGFYREVCNLLGLPLDTLEVEKPVIRKSFTLPAGVLEAVRKAFLFASDDDLRPAMTGVLLEFAGNKLTIVATDAHRLYKSHVFDVSGPEGEYAYILPPSVLKKLPKAVKKDLF